MKERVLTVSNAYFIVWYLGSIDSVSRVGCECFFLEQWCNGSTQGFDPCGSSSNLLCSAIL